MLELDASPGHDPDPLDVVPRQVERDVAEAVDVEHRRDGSPVGELGPGQVEVDERVDREGRAQLLEGDAAREMCGSGREQVAGMERS